MPVLRSRGVTIVEMLIVVTIIGLIAGISFPAVTSGIDSLRLPRHRIRWSVSSTAP